MRGFDEVESPVILQTVEVAMATVFETRSRGRRAERSREGTHAVAASARGVDYESKSVREEARAHFTAYVRRVVRRGVGGVRSPRISYFLLKYPFSRKV